MEINRDNYQAYLLDLLEGRLNRDEQKVLNDFLSMNPDCIDDLKGQELWALEAEKVHFPGKEELKKEFVNPESILTEMNFGLFSIARLEGDLTREQEEKHISMVTENTNWNQEWELWSKTRLVPEQITFTGKTQLKKKKRLNRAMIWLSVVSSAAVIALVITLIRREPEIPVPQVSDMETPVQFPGGDNQKNRNALAAEKASITETDGENIKISGQPAILSIKKHQDFPELTGIRKAESEPVADMDSDKEPIKYISERPVRVAGLIEIQNEFLNPVTYDRILPLEIPPASIHLISLSVSQLADLDLQELMDNYAEFKNISLWSVADAGIRGINRITGSDMSLIASRNPEGYVSGIQFRSKRFSIAAPLDRRE